MKNLFILLFAFTLILKTSTSFALKHGFNHNEGVSLLELHNDQKNLNHSDCHSSKNDKEPSNQTHCDVVCLCSHFSSTLNLISDLSNCKTNDFSITDRSILHTKFFISSFIKSPPKRPPKKIVYFI